MTKVGPALLLLTALLGGCKSDPPAARMCLVDEDCLDTTQYCEGVLAHGTTACTQAAWGTCRPMDVSTLGAVCTGDEQCKFAESACLNGVCAVNACLSTGGLVVCDHGQCPAPSDAGASITIIECAPGCHAGSRLHTCRACLCETCAPPDGSTTNDGAAD
jgi:hypothetical protein